MKTRRLSMLLYGLVGGVFAYAAVVKILDPSAFLSSLLTYELFSRDVASALALFAPILELILALCLITGFMRRGAAWLTGLMLLVFIALIVQARLRGLAIDCGCFGSNHIESGFQYVWKIGENVLLLGGLFAARVLEKRSLQRAGGDGEGHK